MGGSVKSAPSAATNKILMRRNPLPNLLLVACLLLGTATAQAAELPTSLTDQEFWRLVTEFSEPGGNFQAEFMSNEDSSQFVIPTLQQTTRRHGVYIGVGPEQ